MTPLSPAENEVVAALLALSRAFVGLAARSLAALDDDVTLPQFRVLVLLVSRGPQRIVDLAQELEVTSSTAVRMCNRLVRKGLVTREERPQDRRTTWVVLTPRGRDLIGDVMRSRREAIATMISELSLTRPLAFAAVLNAVVEAFGEEPDAQWWARWDATPGTDTASTTGHQPRVDADQVTTDHGEPPADAGQSRPPAS